MGEKQGFLWLLDQLMKWIVSRIVIQCREQHVMSYGKGNFLAMNKSEDRRGELRSISDTDNAEIRTEFDATLIDRMTRYTVLSHSVRKKDSRWKNCDSQDFRRDCRGWMMLRQYGDYTMIIRSACDSDVWSISEATSTDRNYITIVKLIIDLCSWIRFATVHIFFPRSNTKMIDYYSQDHVLISYDIP